MLKYFEPDQVLVIQDLGTWMKPLDSWLYPPTTSDAESPHSLDTCSSVGTRVGNLLASVHCDATLVSKSQTLTDDGKLWFENPENKDIVRDRITGSTLPIQRPRVTPDTGKVEKMVGTILQEIEDGFLHTVPLGSSSSPPSGVPKLMFSIGDLWTGSILVGAPNTTSGSNPNTSFNGGEVEVGLIDWEFASPARIGQDIAQLSAWLYLFATSSSWSLVGPRYRRAVVDTIGISLTPGADPGRLGSDFGDGVDHGPEVEGGAELVTGETLGKSAAGSMLNALFEAYARKVKEHPDYAWFVDGDRDKHKFRKERLAVIRSIWISFGREVIYVAIEADCRFSSFFAVDVGGGEGEEEVKAWQRAMIEVGSWYVLTAGKSPDEEFEEVVRKEGVLRRMYTVSGSL